MVSERALKVANENFESLAVDGIKPHRIFSESLTPVDGSRRTTRTSCVGAMFQEGMRFGAAMSSKRSLIFMSLQSFGSRRRPHMGDTTLSVREILGAQSQARPLRGAPCSLQSMRRLSR